MNENLTKTPLSLVWSFCFQSSKLSLLIWPTHLPCIISHCSYCYYYGIFLLMTLRQQQKNPCNNKMVYNLTINEFQSFWNNDGSWNLSIH
jgi:hypothetical protein